MSSRSPTRACDPARALRRHPAPERGGEEVLLRAEAGVQRLHGHAGVGGDVAQAHRLVGQRGEPLPCGVEQPGPRSPRTARGAGPCGTAGEGFRSLTFRLMHHNVKLRRRGGTMRVFQTLYAIVRQRAAAAGGDAAARRTRATRCSCSPTRPSRQRVEATGADDRPVPHRPSRHGLVPAGRRTRSATGRSARRSRPADRLRDACYLDPIPGTAEESAAAIADFSPDVVVFDFMLLGAAIAAEAAGRAGRRAGALPVPAAHAGRAAVRLRPAVAEARPSGGPSTRSSAGTGARVWRPVTAAINAERVARGLAAGRRLDRPDPRRPRASSSSPHPSSTSPAGCRCPTACATSAPPSSRATRRGRRRGRPTTTGRSSSSA